MSMMPNGSSRLCRRCPKLIEFNETTTPTVRRHYDECTFRTGLQCTSLWSGMFEVPHSRATHVRESHSWVFMVALCSTGTLGMLTLSFQLTRRDIITPLRVHLKFLMLGGELRHLSTASPADSGCAPVTEECISHSISSSWTLKTGCCLDLLHYRALSSLYQTRIHNG